MRGGGSIFVCFYSRLLQSVNVFRQPLKVCLLPMATAVRGIQRRRSVRASFRRDQRNLQKEDTLQITSAGVAPMAAQLFASALASTPPPPLLNLLCFLGHTVCRRCRLRVFHGQDSDVSVTPAGGSQGPRWKHGVAFRLEVPHLARCLSDLFFFPAMKHYLVQYVAKSTPDSAWVLRMSGGWPGTERGS